MTHAAMIGVVLLGTLAGAAFAADPVVITFDKVETGKPVPNYKHKDQGVVFALSRPPAKSKAVGRLKDLNDRERDIAVAVGEGKSNAEISATLYLSVPTVKTHVSRILTKLDLNNRVQIALLAHDAGLLDESR